jgi:hypothetical protein
MGTNGNQWFILNAELLFGLKRNGERQSLGGIVRLMFQLIHCHLILQPFIVRNKKRAAKAALFL